MEDTTKLGLAVIAAATTYSWWRNRYQRRILRALGNVEWQLQRLNYTSRRSPSRMTRRLTATRYPHRDFAFSRQRSPELTRMFAGAGEPETSGTSRAIDRTTQLLLIAIEDGDVSAEQLQVLAEAIKEAATDNGSDLDLNEIAESS